MIGLFKLDHDPSSPAIIDADKGLILSYGDLKKESEHFAKYITAQRSLIFLFCKNRVQEIIAYIGAINKGHCLCLLDAQLDEQFKDQLINLWQPNVILDSSSKTYYDYAPKKTSLDDCETLNGLVFWESEKPAPPLHPDLSLLLSTSGTTGNPKLIRLSQQNLLSNASAISQYLKIDFEERALWGLPFHYSFGLSILHSHLLSGASLIVTESSLLQTPFWEAAKKWNATSFSGVPYSYVLLDKIGIENFDLPTLKTMTQAGGKLDPALIIKFDSMMKKKGGSFVVMYGQTEATARMSYLPPQFLPEKAGSIGIAIPQGCLKIEKLIGSSERDGELVYSGPNVMMGYALQPHDLSQPDELNGTLKTGDVGYVDEEGFYFLTGRLKRIAKIYGLRIQLDDIEEYLKAYGPLAVTSSETHLEIHFERELSSDITVAFKALAEKLHLHPQTFKFHYHARLPRTASGKIEYKNL